MKGQIKSGYQHDVSYEVIIWNVDVEVQDENWSDLADCFARILNKKYIVFRRGYD